MELFAFHVYESLLSFSSGKTLDSMADVHSIWETNIRPMVGIIHEAVVDRDVFKLPSKEREILEYAIVQLIDRLVSAMYPPLKCCVDPSPPRIFLVVPVSASSTDPGTWVPMFQTRLRLVSSWPTGLLINPAYFPELPPTSGN